MKKLLAILCIAIAIFTLFAIPSFALTPELKTEFESLGVDFSATVFTSGYTTSQTENGPVVELTGTSPSGNATTGNTLYFYTTGTLNRIVYGTGGYEYFTLVKTLGTLNVYTITFTKSTTFNMAGSTVGTAIAISPDLAPDPPPPPTPIETILGAVRGFGTAMLDVWGDIVTFVTTSGNSIVLIGLVAWLFVVGCSGFLKIVTM